MFHIRARCYSANDYLSPHGFERKYAQYRVSTYCWEHHSASYGFGECSGVKHNSILEFSIYDNFYIG